MSDLIERQKAIDAVKDADVCVFYSDNQSIDDVLDYTIRATKGSVTASIEQLPSVQPEIVRCKDCCNYDMAQNNVNGICNHLGVPMDVYEWCSRVERKI